MISILFISNNTYRIKMQWLMILSLFVELPIWPNFLSVIIYLNVKKLYGPKKKSLNKNNIKFHFDSLKTPSLIHSKVYYFIFECRVKNRFYFVRTCLNWCLNSMNMTFYVMFLSLLRATYDAKWNLKINAAVLFCFFISFNGRDKKKSRKFFK